MDPLQSSPHHHSNLHPSRGLVIVAFVTIALLLIASFSIYIQRCSSHASSDAPPLPLTYRRAAAKHRGLDPSIINSFPTLTCSDVLKAPPRNLSSKECAVCLGEFVGQETLRLLPKCGHAFHLQCIDMWLASHSTCPVCRAALDEVAAGKAVVVDVGGAENETETLERMNRCRSSNVGGGEGRGRWEWKAKSDRWPFVAKVLPGEGGSKMAVKEEGTSSSQGGTGV